MNIRLILVLLTLFLFAIGFGALNIIAEQDLNLEQAYEEGYIKIIQKSSAGSVPHELMLINTGDRSIRVEKGYSLISDSSEDMVIAREEIIAAGRNGTILAYSLKTEVNVVPETEMDVSKKAPKLIEDLIKISNPQNPAEALKTQLKIWILTSDGDVNIYQGEPQSLINAQRISSFELENNISTAKIELMTQFNLTEDDISNMSANIDLIGVEPTWWDRLVNLFT